MYSKSNSAFIEINQSLNKIYKNLENPLTEELGKELFKKLIVKYIFQNTLIFSMINNLEEKIMEIDIKEASKYINLLSFFFENNNSYDIPFGIYLSYLNPILSIIQSLIVDENIDFLSEIPEIYMKIVQNLMPDDINASNKTLNEDEKKVYEILQNFCIFNLKFDKKINQVIGSLCLTKLVENCPYVLKKEYLKKIIDNIISQLSSENFNAKYELLNCLISLILGAENLFNPFAKLVFNKILDFLTNEDWMKRKLSLNIIYTLSLYCKNEILPLKEHIINILDILKKDKVKEVRDISYLIAPMYEKEKNKINTNKKRNKNLSSGNIMSKIGKINYVKYNNITSFSPNRNIKNIENKIQNLKLKNFSKEINKTPQRVKSSEKRRKTSFNFNNKSISKEKKINRTKNFSFVNEKMVIKPDPNKSIFNTRKNMAFFKQNDNSDSKNKNLIIISNKEDNNDLINKKGNDIDNFLEEKRNEKNMVDNNNIEENMKKINKDYDINKDSINKLITLDAQIKKESNKKFDNNLISSPTKSFNQSKEISEFNHKDIKDNNLIKALLSEVRELSNKQISLLDLMEEIQTNTQNQIEDLNLKIVNLDGTIKELSEQLYLLQNEE